MKKYDFSYIEKEFLAKKENITDIEAWFRTLPFNILLPMIMLNENIDVVYHPAKDPNGIEIEDLNSWHKQREKYINNLIKKYKNEKK